MKLKIRFSFAALLLMSLLIEPANADDAQVAPIYQSPLAEYFSHRVETLTRDVWTYHWGRRSSCASAGIPLSGAVPSTVDMSRYLKRMVALFEDTARNQEDSFGRGLYAALDPISTQSYGEFSFGLLQITLPTNSRILHAQVGVEVTGEARSFLKGNGCLIGEDDLFRSTGVCRKLLLNALSELRIDAVTYDYTPRVPKICDGRQDVAFLLTGHSIINAPTLFFVKQIPTFDSATNARFFINTFARSLSEAPIWDSSELAKDLPSFETDLKEHIYGCGAKYATEDAIH